MNSDRLERVMSAVEELASGEMDVTVHPDGAADVKEYNTDPSLPFCGCKDHEHNCEYCKHTVAAVLKALWDEDCSVEIRGPERETDGGSTSLTPIYDGIPKTLTEIESWVVWERKLDQIVPMDPHDGGVVTDRDKTRSFDTAKEAYNSGMGDGIAFVIDEDDPFTTNRYPNAWSPERDTAVHMLRALVGSTAHYVEVAPNMRDVNAIQLGDDTEHELPIEKRAIPITGREVTTEMVRDEPVATTGGEE